MRTMKQAVAVGEEAKNSQASLMVELSAQAAVPKSPESDRVSLYALHISCFVLIPYPSEPGPRVEIEYEQEQELEGPLR